MIAPRAGALRAVRAGVLGLVSALLAGGAHLAGGGGAPGAVPALLLGAGVVLASVLLTRARLGFPAVLAALALGQLLLHHVLAALVAPTGVPTGTAGSSLGGASSGAATGVIGGVVGGASSGHLHHGQGAGWVTTLLGSPGGLAPAGVHGAPGAAMAAGPSMTLLHVLATLLGALLVARGEAALWALVLWVRPSVPGPAAAPLVPPVTRPAGWMAHAPVRDPRRAAPAAPRGPPVRSRSAVLAA